jgi:hypothetical protein
MNEKRSDTQYYFKVDLRRPGSDLRGFALLGHQTLADLHLAITDESERGAAFLFRFGNTEIEAGTRLDELDLRVGQTFEHIAGAADKIQHKAITVDFVEDD